ncbi:ubiquitin carboxyl-terminal hydrolase 17-like protein 6 [Camelus ferus]|uniref:Ubiquitin carboxyl-terminal hydrolase n=1 Tax=Camelus ferus TaxID=419612 RepID=A0A8B6YA17_CAMFR|nr:ubiquitin carboxyl-terminal hydrolase 17-like protein 6 [Camelus ferus]XP_010951665.1 ubiquitin carboxyl-terminal hydrolase 17-like protein 6 [Camelus bactrianus]
MEAASLNWGDAYQFNVFPKLKSSQSGAAGGDVQWGPSRPEKSSASSETACNQRSDLAPVSAGLAPAKKRLSWKTPSVAGAGLQNTGNTCYVNAALQCLTHTPPLASSMLSRQHWKVCQKRAFCMVCAVQAHVTRALLHPGEVIKPRQDLVTSFHRDQQEDAHEFLMFMLNAMQQVCLSGYELSDRHSEDTSLVPRIFGGSWRSQIQCLHCLGVSDTFDPYLDITLDISAAQSVNQALRELVKPEQLDGENSYHCSVCLRKVPATKRLTLHRASKVLILVLKRFTDFTGGKVGKKVCYPECLDLSPYMSEQEAGPLDYVLYAVLVHSGWSCHRGHYFCYVKAGNGQWYRMDDAKVTACDGTSALSQSAYVLFYVQKSELEGDGKGVSTGQEAASLGAEPTGMAAAHQEPDRDSSVRVPGSEEQLEDTETPEVTLEQWRCLQELSRPKPEFTLRKVDSDVPADAVVIHQSKYGDRMRMKQPEQDTYQPSPSGREASAQGPIVIGSIPCLRGKPRASKKKGKKKQRSAGALQ